MEREIELRLVARLRTGDAAVFETVYEAFRARLYSFLLRLSHRRDVAEDLLEETWLRFVARARDLRADTCLAAWLFTVARNLYATWCRNQLLHDERLSDLTPSWPAVARRESPFEATARTETERRLETALARLTSGDREVLLLVAIDELTPSDAAASLGLTPEALRKRLQRARERLAVEMGAELASAQMKTGERKWL